MMIFSAGAPRPGRPRRSTGGARTSCCCGGMLGGMLIAFLVAGVIGVFLCDYVFSTLFGLHLPLWADAVIGFVGGEVVVPVAIIAWVLTLCGVGAPFFHIGS